VKHRQHEIDRVDAAALGKVAMGFFTALLLVLVAMYVLWQRLLPNTVDVPAAQVPPQPRLQAVPRTDRIALYRAQRQQLESYGWVNQHDGVAHIPVERAMALLAAQQGAAHGQGGTQR
jgi:hypothetical protein